MSLLTGASSLANEGIPAPDSSPKSSLGKQGSVRCANLGTRVLSSSRQTGQATDLKKAPRTAANNSGKCNLLTSLVRQAVLRP